MSALFLLGLSAFLLTLSVVIIFILARNVKRVQKENLKLKSDLVQNLEQQTRTTAAHIRDLKSIQSQFSEVTGYNKLLEGMEKEQASYRFN